MEYTVIIISSVLLSCATLVIGVQNPIHSILFLILVFFNGSLLLFFLQIEFFALIFLIVYVGAIIVLFLFMVMMLKIKHINVAQKILDFFPFGSLIGFFLLLEFLILMKSTALPSSGIFWSLVPLNIDTVLHKVFTFQVNIENLGKALYTSYIFPFVEMGFILFVAMVGAIVIALESDDTKPYLVKRQDLIDQAVQTNKNMVYFSLQNLKKNKVCIRSNLYQKLWKISLIKYSDIKKFNFFIK